MRHSFRPILTLTLALSLVKAAAQSFAAPVAYQLGANTSPSSLASGDVNNDGYPDLVATSPTTSTVGVLLNTRSGTFAPVVFYPTGTGTSYSLQRVALGDVDVDGYPDLIVTTGSVSGPVAVLRNLRNGTFGAPTVLSGANGGQGLAVADVNGDNYPDILTVGSPGFGGATVKVLLNTQQGAFAPAVSYPVVNLNGSYPFGLAVGDMNNDGYPDLAVADYTYSVHLLLNQHNGTFAASVRYPIGASAGTLRQPVDVVLGDLNNDGYLDLAVADIIGTVDVLFNNQSGGLLPVLLYPAGGGGFPYKIAVGDVDGDGRPDLVLTNSPASTVSVLLNTTPLPTRAALPGATASLVPNPTTGGAATLALAGLPAAVARVQATLLDATGRAVARHPLAAHQGAARGEVPTAGLAAGLYVLRLAAEDAQGTAVGSLPAQRLSVQ